MQEQYLIKIMMKIYSILLLFLFAIGSTANAACDYTSADPIIITPSGTHNATAGYTQLYVLTDFNGDIIAVNATGNFGTQGFGSYNVYAINYEDASPPTIPVVGVNISTINTGCVALSPALPITVCETSLDSVCEDGGVDIVLAMNADFNFDANYNQVVVITDAAGNIISIKTLNLVTGMVSYTTTSGGELPFGDYTAYAVNYENPETLATLGLTVGAAWTGTFGVACADASAGDLIQVDQCCGTTVGILAASTTGNTTNFNAPVNEFILCDGDNFVVDSVSGYVAAPGANPALDYAIYTCQPTAGLEPANDPCFSGAFIETPPSVLENNNGGINSNIMAYLTGQGLTVTNNTVWIVPTTLSVAAASANQYDPACYDLGTPYKVTYLNPITTAAVENCDSGTVVITISGGYPEFFTGNYNITNTGGGTLSSSTVTAHGDSVTISGLTFGDNYSLTILDDNNCPVTYTGAAFPNCTCPASVGNVAVTADGTLVGTNEYDLTDCGTITFTASNEDLNSGALTYGWAVFSCRPTLPFTAAEILDFNVNACYLGSDTGLTTSDVDSAGISGGIAGGFDTLYIVPYTSEASLGGSLDDDADGCYAYGDVYQINYIAPTCGDCSAPACPIGSVPLFTDRTYLNCDVICAAVNDVTRETYHTVTTDAFGNVGVVQTISFSELICSSLTRSAVLRDVANSCVLTGADSLPTTLNGNGVASGFNPEWRGLTPNTNYTLVITTVIGSSCNYSSACVDYYGILECVVNVGTTTAITTDATNNDYVLCFNEEIDLATTGYTLPAEPSAPTIGYALYTCAPTTNDPATDPCFSGSYVVGDAANSVNDGTFTAAMAAVNQTIWLVPITMDTAVSPIFDHDFDNDGCYAMGTPIEITYLNEIDTIVTADCSMGEVAVQISGGYPEFFTGNYNITNNGAGTLDVAAVTSHNGIVTITGLTNGMNYDISIVDDNNCTITNVTGTYIAALIDSIPVVDATCDTYADGQLEVFTSNTGGSITYTVNGIVQIDNPIFTGLSEGSYFVEITDGNGCYDSLSVLISDPDPIVVTPGAESLICIGESAILSATATGGTGTIVYSWVDDLGAPIAGQNPSVSPTDTTTYTVTATDDNGCPSNDSTLTITLRDSLSVAAFTATTICLGETATLSAVASGGDGVYSYSWTNTTLTGTPIVVSPTTSTTYQVTLTDGCTTPSVNDTVTITVRNAPDATFTGDTTGCDNVTGTFTATDFNNPIYNTATFSWDFGNGSSSSVKDAISYTYSSAGCYDVSYTITDAFGCVGSDTLFNSVCVYASPLADFSYSPTEIDILNPTVEFVDLSFGANLVYEWTFEDNVTPETSIAINPIIDFPETAGGTYTACLTVTDNITTCTSRNCKQLVVGDVLFFFIPNAFTPDNDFRNETFRPIISGVEIEEYTFKIFDRWGELVFESRNLSNGWDGHYKSKLDIKQDVYVWKVRFYDPTTNTYIDKVGNVSLIR
jgi:gliding motility-associated-like protein